MSVGDRVIQRAIWEGATDTLQDLAPCRCCCSEHTYPSCPARVWNGCRSGLAPGERFSYDEDSWARHYERFHGMSREAFFDEETV